MWAIYNTTSRFISGLSLMLITVIATSCSNNYERIGYIEGEFIYMASPVSGYLEQLLVKSGSQVVAGQQLYTLQSETVTQDYHAAKQQMLQAQAELDDLLKGQRPTELEALAADIAKAKAELMLADVDKRRGEQLVGDATISQAEQDKLVSRYESSKANLHAAEAKFATALLGAREDEQKAAYANLARLQASLASAKWLSEQTKMSAPTYSLVFDTYYLPGEWVQAGRPVLALLAPEQIQAVFFISQKQLAQIQVGDEVLINCDQCSDSAKATVVYISPQPEYTPPVIYDREQRDKLVYKVEADFSDDIAKKFHPGQPISVILQ